MGFSAAIIKRPSSEVHQLHSVEKPGNWRLQNSRSIRSCQIVGNSKEPSVDEL